MIDVIFDVLANVILFLIGTFIGCAYSLYRKCLKEVNALETQMVESLEATQHSLKDIHFKIEMINLKIGITLPHPLPEYKWEAPIKKRRGRKPKSIEMKNPQP